jgi:hypothetical protein
MKHQFVNGKSMVNIMLGALYEVKFAPWFPHKTGNLRNKATKIREIDDAYEIYFDEDIAPYITFLEDGTNPHFIPFAFGRNQIVFHPGSNKHEGFISNKSSMLATLFIGKQLKGKVEFYVND